MWKEAITSITTAAVVCLLPGAASAAEGSRDLGAGFLSRGLAAQQAKGFDVGGSFSVAGFLGVGIGNPVRSVHLQGRNAVFRMDRDVNTAAFLLVRTAQSNFGSVLKTFVVGANASGVDDGEFVINDLGTALQGAGSRRLTIDNEGNFGLNTASPIAALQVHGTGSPFLLGLLDGGTARLTVDSSGVVLINEGFVVFRTLVTPDAYALPQLSSTLVDVGEGVDEEAWLALNGSSALLASPGDGDFGIFSIFDQDIIAVNQEALSRYTFFNNELHMRSVGDKAIRAPDLDNNGVLTLSTSGSEIRAVVDDNGDRAQAGSFTYRWFQTNTASSNTLMGLDQDGDLGIAGSLSEMNAFDLAEAFWKDDAVIEAGDVVRVSPRAANAVVLADREADPAVVGVGGEETAEAFEDERAGLETEALAKRPDLVEIAAALQSFEEFMGLRASAGFGKAASKPEDEERLRAEYGDQLDRLQQDLESAALEVFFESRFIRLALAGRVPVKVDAGFGAVRAGDLLVASPTPGYAMRAADPAPGTVIGKALEPLSSGTGRVMMLVMMH